MEKKASLNIILSLMRQPVLIFLENKLQASLCCQDEAHKFSDFFFVKTELMALVGICLCATLLITGLKSTLNCHWT